MIQEKAHWGNNKGPKSMLIKSVSINLWKFFPDRIILYNITNNPLSKSTYERYQIEFNIN